MKQIRLAIKRYIDTNPENKAAEIRAHLNQAKTLLAERQEPQAHVLLALTHYLLGELNRNNDDYQYAMALLNNIDSESFTSDDSPWLLRQHLLQETLAILVSGGVPVTDTSSEKQSIFKKLYAADQGWIDTGIYSHCVYYDVLVEVIEQSIDSDEETAMYVLYKLLEESSRMICSN